ncbi:MAG: hypothetical protein ACI88L_000443 [Candidatus Paceibacteria bacterium]|jgi:hypothetical protein
MELLSIFLVFDFYELNKITTSASIIPEWFWNPWVMVILLITLIVFLGASWVLRGEDIKSYEIAIPVYKDKIKEEIDQKHEAIESLNKNKENLSKFAISLFVNPERAEGLAKSIAPYAEEMHVDTYDQFISILIGKLREELETSLDGEHFTEIFPRASKFVDILQEGGDRESPWEFLNLLNRNIFDDKDLIEKTKSCISDVFNSKKTNPLLSYLNYREMVGRLKTDDSVVYNRFKSLNNILLNHASKSMHKALADQISYCHEKKKVLLEVKGYEFKTLYNDVLPKILSMSDDVLSPFHKGLLKGMRDSEFKKYSEKIKG